MISLNMWIKLHKLTKYNKLALFKALKLWDVNFLYFLYFLELTCYWLKIMLKPNYPKTNLIFSVFFFKYEDSNIFKIFITIKNLYSYKLLTRLNTIIFNIKWILLAAIVAIIYAYISIFYIQIDFTKQIAVWYLGFISYYLLMSSFNSFLVKYRYGKFTSAIQRFWKRTGMIFWLIEGFLFLLFFYYFVNSSQEPLYMFDYSNLNQEFVIQLKSSYKNMILLSLAIYISFILILNINFFLFSQSILILFFISLIIFYTLYIESYQFVYIINLFADKDWIFDNIEQIWVLEAEENNLRVKQQYFILCLIAKYWHFIFIFISWFFFLVKSLESSKISITLLGYNTQNLLILYILNILCLVQWIKVIFKKFFDITYYWFHLQYDEKFFINFLIEMLNIIKNYFSFSNDVISSNLNNISLILYSSNELTIWKYIN